MLRIALFIPLALAWQNPSVNLARTSAAVCRRGIPSSSLDPPEKGTLLSLIEELEAQGSNRGSSSPVAQGIQLQSLIESLALKTPNPNCARDSKERESLIGTWRLIYSSRSNLGLESKEWLQYLVENGPSPIQVGL
jgi:hypothetical protein